MPRTIRFHLDENCDPRIAAGLRLHRIDVTTSLEVGLRRASDMEQLAYAISTRRSIITQDADFLRLRASGVERPGVVFYPSQVRTIGEVVRCAVLIWELLEPDEMRNHVEYI